MCPQAYPPRGDSETLSISKDGHIKIPQALIEQLRWANESRITLLYIDEGLVVLLRPARQREAGYKLSILNRGSKRPGGKIGCTAFYQDVLRTRIVVPSRSILPIMPKSNPQLLGVRLEELPWLTEQFSMTGAKNIAADLVGVYRYHSSDGEIQYLGKGEIRNRAIDHMRDERFVRLVRTITYCPLRSAEDCIIMESILLTEYEYEYGHLPELNQIRA
jgi:hypothetical protein